MLYYRYSREQLEGKAEELLMRFDPDRLIKTKPIDVYAVIEKCLDVPYDWKYLTPDQSIYGMTAFKSGYLWVWPVPYYEDGIMPEKIFVAEGTILIDSTLTEYDNRGPENFTVMHEVFHQVLHKRCFAHNNPDYTHSTTREAIRSRKKPMTPLEICEYQANYCASAFLMPRELVTKELYRHLGSKRQLVISRSEAYGIIKTMAKDFSVSQTSMRYRLLNLGLAVE